MATVSVKGLKLKTPRTPRGICLFSSAVPRCY